MAFAFNPITGKLDLVGEGSGGATLGANTFTAGQTIASGTLTSSSPALALTQTWNASGQVFSAMTVNVTDTASNNSSLLLALQTGGTTRFSVNKFGNIFANEIVVASFQARSNGVFIGGSQPLQWGAGSATGTMDIYLYRDAANTLAQRNGTNAQAFRLYNTFTDASNFERGFFRWNANTLEIGTEAGGTGTGRNLQFIVNGTTVAATISGDLDIKSNLRLKSQALITSPAYGKILMTDAGHAVSGSPYLLWGGSTTAFPSIKRSGTTLQVRLANDSDFTSIQGKITTETAYTATPITPTGFITLYDSTGTAYKVACSL